MLPTNYGPAVAALVVILLIVIVAAQLTALVVNGQRHQELKANFARLDKRVSEVEALAASLNAEAREALATVVACAVDGLERSRRELTQDYDPYVRFANADMDEYVPVEGPDTISVVDDAAPLARRTPGAALAAEANDQQPSGGWFTAEAASEPDEPVTDASGDPDPLATSASDLDLDLAAAIGSTHDTIVCRELVTATTGQLPRIQ